MTEVRLLEKKLTKRQFDGLNITLEVMKDQYRTGRDASGKEWKSKMYCHYGYILRTHSPDGEHLDCFLKAYSSRHIFVDSFQLPFVKHPFYVLSLEFARL